MDAGDLASLQELEETLKQERNNEQLLRAEKDLEQRENLLWLDNVLLTLLGVLETVGVLEIRGECDVSRAANFEEECPGYLGMIYIYIYNVI